MNAIENLKNFCFNQIIKNNFTAARREYTSAYGNHPGEIGFFYGILSCLFLQENFEGAMEFLQRERDVSLHKAQIRCLLRFIHHNGDFKGAAPYTVLYNSGTYLEKEFKEPETALFFKICDLLAPGRPESLTRLGEVEILQGNYKKGLSLFARAAEVVKKHGGNG